VEGISVLSSLVYDEICGHEHFELAVHEAKDLVFLLLAFVGAVNFVLTVLFGVLCVMKAVSCHPLPRKGSDLLFPYVILSPSFNSKNILF